MKATYSAPISCSSTTAELAVFHLTASYHVRTLKLDSPREASVSCRLVLHDRDPEGAVFLAHAEVEGSVVADGL